MENYRASGPITRRVFFAAETTESALSCMTNEELQNSECRSCLLRSILASAPDHVEALEGLGHIAIRQGDHGRAAEYLIQVAAHTPMSLE